MRNVEEEENSENENETEVNLGPPTKTEIQLALSQLKKGRSSRFRKYVFIRKY